MSHGHELTRELYRGLDKPVSLRHGTPDARLLAEVAIASGIAEIEGGGICYCLPYSEGFPLDRCLLYWQYVDRVCALNSTPERPIHRESFGPLTATLVPPAIAVADPDHRGPARGGAGRRSRSRSASGRRDRCIQDIATRKGAAQTHPRTTWTSSASIPCASISSITSGWASFRAQRERRRR